MTSICLMYVYQTFYSRIHISPVFFFFCWSKIGLYLKVRDGLTAWPVSNFSRPLSFRECNGDGRFRSWNGAESKTEFRWFDRTEAKTEFRWLEETEAKTEFRWLDGHGSLRLDPLKTRKQKTRFLKTEPVPSPEIPCGFKKLVCRRSD